LAAEVVAAFADFGVVVLQAFAGIGEDQTISAMACLLLAIQAV
jgi:hypothetical protein